MTIKENIEFVRSKLPEHVTLINVSKTKSCEEILEAYNAGEREFGENKVQEMCEKFETLPKDINWHLIGHLQRNKVKYIVGKVSLIHSLDSLRLLNEIDKRYGEKEEIANVLVQVNIGKEESKTGIEFEELDDLLKEVEKCSNVKVKGLMAIIPIGNEEECKKYFKEMKNIFDDIKERTYKNVDMEILSMGMSGDYVQAIEEGSNMVRVGQGIFGKRNYNI